MLKANDTKGSTSTQQGLTMASPQTQASAFSLLSISSAALATLAIFLPPELLLNAAFPASAQSALDPVFLRIAGATLVISSAVEYCLKDAAENGRLASATYQRLMVGCAVKSTAYLAAFAASPDVWSPLVVALYPTAAAASLALNVGVLQANNKQQQGKEPASLAVPLSSSTRDGWIYSAFALIYIGTALACWAPAGGPSLFSPDISESAAGQLLKHTWSPGFLLAAVACINLKDAADRGRLGASTFKRLNLGIAGLETAYSMSFAGAMFSGMAPTDLSSPAGSNLAASLGIALFCLWKGTQSKK